MLSEIIIYWDDDDHVWVYWLHHGDGQFTLGSLDYPPTTDEDMLADAVVELAYDHGLDLVPTDVATTTNDGGAAYWTAPEPTPTKPN